MKFRLRQASPHPIILPPRPAQTAGPPPKLGKKWFLGYFFSIFYPSKLQCKFCIEKIPPKMRKSRILVSQNPPQTLPKSLQNRTPKKHAILIDLGVDFSSFFDSPTLKFYAHTQCFVRIFNFSPLPIAPRFWLRKTSQKHLRNHPETMKKSMPKTCCFLTSLF